MLVSFSVANFRSFSTEQLFSLSAGRPLDEAQAAHVVAIEAGRGGVLRTGVIYGANAAGRSSLPKALAFMKDAALVAHQGPGTGRTPFGDDGMSALPSAFDVQLLHGGKLYRYGFSIDNERIVEEWLAQTVNNQERPLVQRRTLRDGRVEITTPGLAVQSPKLATLIATGVGPAQTLLASACRQLTAAELGEALSDVIEWFAMGLSLLTPDSTPGLLGQSLAKDAQFREFASDFLRSCGTGIHSIQVRQQSLSREELCATLPSSLITYLFRQRGPYQASIPLPDDAELLVERSADSVSFRRLSIQTTHSSRGKQTMRDLSEESAETRRLLALAPALYQCSKGAAVFCIDEIDRGLKPLAVRKVIEYFLATSAPHPCQIIATTHDTQLLTRELLRRDEIWFMEQDSRGASHLYSLIDCKIHPGLSRGSGRSGALRFAGEEQLLESQPETADL